MRTVSFLSFFLCVKSDVTLWRDRNILPVKTLGKPVAAKEPLLIHVPIQPYVVKTKSLYAAFRLRHALPISPMAPTPRRAKVEGSGTAVIGGGLKLPRLAARAS